MSSTHVAHAASPRRTAALKDSLAVRRMTPALGAEIGNIDLRVPLDKEGAIELRDLLHAHKVLVFRDQEITHAEHLAFSRSFGDLENVPMGLSHPEFPELVVFDSGPTRRATENLWHTDSTFWRRPPAACVLRCLELPELGGDTIWANMALAYKNLPSEIQDKIEGLHAVHDMMPNFGHKFPISDHPRMRAENPPMVHPVVLSHPITGEKILYVNTGFVTHTYDYRRKFPTTEGAQYKTAAAELLLYLLRQSQIPEYQMRLRWTPNTVVMWDNIATQHYAISDYYPAVRVVARTTILAAEISA